MISIAVTNSIKSSSQPNLSSSTFTNIVHLKTGSISSISTSLPPLLSSASRIYTDIPFTPSSASRNSHSIFSRFLSSLRKISSNATTSTSTPTTSTGNNASSSATSSSLSSLVSSLPISPLNPLVHELRVVKSEAEIRLLRQIGQVTGRAFQGVMRRKWDYESEIEAWMEYEFRRKWMDSSAYVPVVAGGKVSWKCKFISVEEQWYSS